MKRWTERALNIQPGDLGRGLLLCACLFLILSSYVTGRVARDALFLARFQAVQLPYADIASAVFVGIVVFGYVRLSRITSVRNLLIGCQFFFATNCLIFWWLARYRHPVWLYPAFYVWVSLFGVLAPTQVWTLANYLLTTREAKRIFGIVGGGAILGGTFAGLFSKIVVKRFGTESLLLGMALFLLICTALMAALWHTWKSPLGDAARLGAESRGLPQKDMHGGWRLILSSPYLRAIAPVILFSSYVSTLTDWQFKAVAKQFLVNKDALATLFGDFYFYAGILGLLVQLLLTSRLLRRFGIGTMLFVLPTVVMMGSAGLLILGTLTSALALKGGIQVLRFSLDRSATELLYLPIPHGLKLRAKAFIDTVIWRLGDGLAGLTALIFATYLHVTPRYVSWVAMVIIGVWFVSAAVAGRRYVATLRENISQHRLDVEQASAPVLDRSTTELLATNLSASDPKDILYALSLFEVEQQRAAHPAIRALLTHSAPEVRQKAISILSSAGDVAAVPDVKRLLRDPELSVRTEALLFLSHHAHIDPLTSIEQLGDFPDFSVRSAVVAFLAQPGEAQNCEAARDILDSMVSESGEEGLRNRLEAARLLGGLPDCFDPLLSRLIADDDHYVACEAIRAVGRLHKRRLVPELLDRLGDPKLAPSAVQALGSFGDSIVGGLRDHLCDANVPIQARREIPAVLVALGTPAAAGVLLDNLLQRDTTLRFRTINALNKLCRQNPQISLDPQMLETVLAAEIMGHYRSYQILATIGATTDGADPLARGLKESIHQELERIFLLLNLLHPRLDLHNAYLGLQSGNAAVHDNALEFLDNVLKANLREMLVPLLDSKVTVAERARMAHTLVRANIESQEQAVAELIASEDPWLKSCGAYAIGTLGLKSLEGHLDRCLNEADPLLRETARAAKLRLENIADSSDANVIVPQIPSPS